MSRYLSEFHFCQLTDKIASLDAPLIYESDLMGLIEVPAGFQTDFASVPRIPIFYMLYGDRAHKSAVLHDYLYRIDSKPPASFSQANSVFLEAMGIEHSWHVRYPMYLGVVLGGWWSYHKRRVMDRL